MYFKMILTRNPLLFSLFIMCMLLSTVAPAQKKVANEYYQLKIYHIKNQDQKIILDNYMESAFIPALHRSGIKNVGVFYPAQIGKENAANEDTLLYVLIPFKSLDQFATLDATLGNDKQYLKAGKEYLQSPSDNPPYSRFESILMEAFSGMPVLATHGRATSNTIYELRSYEAATEKLHLNKVKMFNDGEIEIFNRLGFNAIFYARVLAGGKMPNLIYMTSFQDMESRDAHWENFGNDPGWKKLLADPQYNHNFLKADVYLLHAKPYSDI